MQNSNLVTIETQLFLNRRMYESGKISFNMFTQAQNILNSQLTEQQRIHRISLNEMKQGVEYGLTKDSQPA